MRELPDNLFKRLVVMGSPDPPPDPLKERGCIYDLVTFNQETKVAAYALRDAEDDA